MKISVVQMEPGASRQENIAQADCLIRRAVLADAPRLLILPETWSCLGGDPATRLQAGETLSATGSPTTSAYAFLRDTARRHRIYVHGGSIGERVGDRLFNTTIVFSPEGEEVARYRKIHLFDADAADGAGYRESAEYGTGDAVVTCQIDGLTIGCSICYDLRFPELFLALRRAGAELILLPSAFTLHTGRDHWEPLLRARAIDTQCWVAAAATWGVHREAGEPRATYGHSLVCDPWGHVVASVPDGPGWASATIDPQRTAAIRARMPLLQHRAPWER